MLEVLQPDDSRSCKVGIEQSLAADGATAFFSSILIPSRLDAQRAAAEGQRSATGRMK